MNASRNHLKFGTFTREDAKRWPYLFLKSFQNVSTNHTKIHDFGVKGYQNQPKGCPGELRKRSWKQVGSGTPKKMLTPGARHTLLGTIWAILGAILGTAGRQGVPKSSVLAPGCAKISKHDIQNEASETICNFNGNLFGKCEFLNVLNPPKWFIYKHFGGFSTLK